MSEVVGLFRTRDEAERAVEELSGRGHEVHNVGYVDRYRDEQGDIVTDESYFDESDYYESDNDTAEEAATGAAGGAIGGAAVGAGAGLLASAGLVLVPGIGPFLAAGTLAGTLAATAAGAVGGAAIGGAAGAIFGEVDDNDYADHETSKHYREGVAQGDALVTVEVNDDMANQVAEDLRSLGARRVDVYGDDGWYQ